VDFSLTDEQQELQAQAGEVLAGEPPPWQQLAELGWLGVSVSEEHGGAGLSFLEEALLHEQLGYALFDGPLLATLLAIPGLEPGEQARAVAGERRWSIEVRGLVPEWGRVDAVLTEGGPADPIGEALESIDPTRPVGRLGSRGGTSQFPQTPSTGPLRGQAPSAPGGGELSPRAAAALACEAVGVARRALELAVEHASTREQFGRPIGVYQAVSHPLADTYAESELARSLAYWAAWCVAEDEPQAPLAALAAKAYATEAAVAACERAIQIHGGIGFTWEHVLHRYYKRALWLEAFGGRPHEQREALAAALLDEGAAPGRSTATEEAAWTA
jgi:alkylation response protein AidB-like acyl-CoA dehydrogenase